MKSLVVFILMSISSVSLFAEYLYSYKNPSDSTNNSYLLILPENQTSKGLIVRDYTNLPDMDKKSPFKLTDLAIDNGFAVLYTDTSLYYPELFYSDEGPEIIDEFIKEVTDKYLINRNNIFIGGISASGTRALRFAQYCQQNKSKYGTKIKGVFVVDSPLDIERFYLSATRNNKKFKSGMAYEANFVPQVFEQVLGGTLDEKLKEYRKASVFSQFAEDYGNAKHYLSQSMIFFHEPDIEWWINERGSSYFDINSFDIAAFVNYQRLFGNKDVELVTTEGKGFDRVGNHKCHSWTIVDEAYLMNWILDRTQE